MTGFTKHVREQVLNRAYQHCEKCGLAANAFQWHHRRPRSMGGSKAPDTNTAANCLLLCVPCHQWVEANRDDALHYGWLVRQGHSPAEMPVWIGWRWVLIRDDGTVEER
jgi:5-methylcytosine-specific restriction protein A